MGNRRAYKLQHVRLCTKDKGVLTDRFLFVCFLIFYAEFGVLQKFNAAVNMPATGLVTIRLFYD